MNRDSRQVLTEWLVLSAQGGSEAAFKDLYDLWQADLRRLALTRVERAEGADEVSTDIWLAIARGLSRLDDPACFPRWAFRIVERRCNDWIRQRDLARRREKAASAEAENLAPPPTQPPEEADDVFRLRLAVAALPADDRKLLHLFYDLGRTVSEVAEAFGIPAGTVKSRLFSVRESLKRILERKRT
ncbi:MAG: sigma-70 family RNA polymerase sigma factor [Nibricoccus sp.]